MANFQNLNFPTESHFVKNIYQESLGHFMFGLTFWQVDFWEVDHFSKYYFLQLPKEERSDWAIRQSMLCPILNLLLL